MLYSIYRRQENADARRSLTRAEIRIIYGLKQGNMNVLESKKNYVDCDVKLCGEVLKRFTDRCCLTFIIKKSFLFDVKYFSTRLEGSKVKRMEINSVIFFFFSYYFLMN